MCNMVKQNMRTTLHCFCVVLVHGTVDKDCFNNVFDYTPCWWQMVCRSIASANSSMIRRKHSIATVQFCAQKGFNEEKTIKLLPVLYCTNGKQWNQSHHCCTTRNHNDHLTTRPEMRNEDQLVMIYILYKGYATEILIFWDIVMCHWLNGHRFFEGMWSHVLTLSTGLKTTKCITTDRASHPRWPKLSTCHWRFLTLVSNVRTSKLVNLK